jgi:hypothetical protein
MAYSHENQLKISSAFRAIPATSRLSLAMRRVRGECGFAKISVNVPRGTL